MSMAASVEHLGDAFKEAFGSRGIPTPKRKERAQAKLQNEDELPELTRQEKVRLHILFTNNVNAADAYFTANDDFRLDVARTLLE
jgi:hypothetical protein